MSYNCFEIRYSMYVVCIIRAYHTYTHVIFHYIYMCVYDVYIYIYYIYIYIYICSETRMLTKLNAFLSAEPMAVGFPFSFFVCEHLPRFPLQPSPPFAIALATIPPLTSLSPFSFVALPPSLPNNGKNSFVPPNTSEISFSSYARKKNLLVLPSYNYTL